MNLPQELEQRIVALLREQGAIADGPLTCRRATGGSINDAASVHNGTKTLFVKWNDARSYPGMFEAEARGLKLLADPGGALVPEVKETGEAGRHAYLVMEFIEAGSPGEKSPELFGEMLAILHRNTSPTFGLDHDNYMGSLPQRNTPHSYWNDFFIQERLVPQLRIARDEGSLSAADSQSFDRLFKRLPAIIPEEPPALVHGDLWSGNYIHGTRDRTWLIDPAAAYGHREVDIAMSRLFGGFPARFYEAYNRHFPLVGGWEGRTEIFQLYPLLIHVNLFGGGYTGQVKSVIKRF